MTVAPIVPLVPLAHDPDFLASLTDLEILWLAYSDLWLRPEQVVPGHDYRYAGYVGGRGWGKSYAIAQEINQRVQNGVSSHIGLIAPTEDRVEDVQIKFLIDTSPPWFKAHRYKGGVVWPNGADAIGFTPEAPGRSRSENLDTTWACELVDWKPSTRKEAWDNITTATRVGCAQVLWDTTSKGKNELIQHLIELNKQDPTVYPIMRGSMFDNPYLSRKYLAAECAKYTGRRFEEEVLGKVFTESAGALWQQEWLDNFRVYEHPSLELTLVSVDPAQSARHDADETGIVVGGRGYDRHAYVLEDLTGRYPPEQWGDIVVQQCVQRKAAGAIVERNHLGDNATFVIRSRASVAGLTVRVLAKDKPFPRYTPGVIYVREVHARQSKSSRAEGPASETEAGCVHLVGRFDALEFQLTTWEPGESKSPNNLDALAYLIAEIRELSEERPRQAASEAVLDAGRAQVEFMRALNSRGRRVGM